MVAPPNVERDYGCRSAMHRVLYEHIRRSRAFDSTHARAEHEHRLQLNIVGKVGCRRAARHAGGDRRDRS